MLTTANHQAYYPLTAQKNAGGIGLLSKAVNSRNVPSNAAFVRLALPLMGGLGGEPKCSLVRFPSSPTRSVPPTRLDSGVRLNNLNESEQTMQNEALSLQENRTINRALHIFERKFTSDQLLFNNPDAVKRYFQLRIGALEHEEFHVLWLDTQNRLIVSEKLFSGTLTQTEVHPRELVKSALKHNAASVILAHNHPSGTCKASDADLSLTQFLKSLLAQIQVQLLDHIIVTPLTATSLSEQGVI